MSFIPLSATAIILPRTEPESESGFVLKIIVKDMGIGLTEENKEKLFTSFQRFDLRRNQTVEGFECEEAAEKAQEVWEKIGSVL